MVLGKLTCYTWGFSTQKSTFNMSQAMRGHAWYAGTYTGQYSTQLLA